MDGDGEKAGAQKPRPSADGGTSDRRTKTEGKKAVRDEGAGEGGREGARLTAIAVASLAPRGNIEREGGAAVTEGAGENCCCCLAWRSLSLLRREKEWHVL